MRAAIPFSLLLLLSAHFAVAGDESIQPMKSTANRIVVRLDLDGTRGLVIFDHKQHEAFINTDPNFPHKATAGIATGVAVRRLWIDEGRNRRS